MATSVARFTLALRTPRWDSRSLVTAETHPPQCIPETSKVREGEEDEEVANDADDDDSRRLSPSSSCRAPPLVEISTAPFAGPESPQPSPELPPSPPEPPEPPPKPLILPPPPRASQVTSDETEEALPAGFGRVRAAVAAARLGTARAKNERPHLEEIECVSSRPSGGREEEEEEEEEEAKVTTTTALCNWTERWRRCCCTSVFLPLLAVTARLDDARIISRS
jgi:hypothetical protein